MLLLRENMVVVTQHVKDIKTLSEAQNAQLQHAMDAGDRAGDTGTRHNWPPSRVVAAQAAVLRIKIRAEERERDRRTEHAARRSAQKRQSYRRSQLR